MERKIKNDYSRADSKIRAIVVQLSAPATDGDDALKMSMSSFAGITAKLPIE